jgi:hypothetical protein
MTTTSGDASLKIVPMTARTAEVRLSVGPSVVSIGRVATENGRWYWQHRDGEQSSPLATSRVEAAHLLANYHRAFKAQVASMAPTAARRRLLFG